MKEVLVEFIPVSDKHSPTKETDEFYEALENVYEKVPSTRNGYNFLGEDFNAKISENEV